MGMLEKVKLALRISTNTFDSEIMELIQAAQDDLSLAGVVLPEGWENDSLINMAITIFCKANFGIANADSSKYQRSYTMLKTRLLISGDYNGGYRT